MALASEEEWESDPELRQMRKDFLASFSERRKKLEALVPLLAQGKPGDQAYGEAVAAALHVAHKLAGAAETYGFPTVSRACAAYEDRLEQCPAAEREPAEMREAVELIADLLKRAQELAKDPKDLAADPRLARLLSKLRA